MKNLPLLCLLLMVACERFPKDASSTLQHIQGRQLAVGYASNSNYSTGPEPKGPVIDMVKAYANHLHATLKWVPAQQSDVVELLKNQEIQMAIGAFTKSSPYKKEVAFTKPCYIEKIKIGAPAGTIIPSDIEGKEVYVSDPLVAMYVHEKKGKAVMADSLVNSMGLVASTEDNLKKQGLQASTYSLHEVQYVIAIPKGENAYLMDLEKFIDSYGKE